MVPPAPNVVLLFECNDWSGMLENEESLPCWLSSLLSVNDALQLCALPCLNKCSVDEERKFPGAGGDFWRNPIKLCWPRDGTLRWVGLDVFFAVVFCLFASGSCDWKEDNDVTGRLEAL